MSHKPDNDQPWCDADPDAISIEQARARILCHVPRLNGTEAVALAEARGRVLSEALVVSKPVPPFRASAMDGYALRQADAPRTHWTVAGDSLAGHPASDLLPPGACVRITTGARIPNDADTVVIQENVQRDGNRIQMQSLPKAGTHVRDVGSNLAQGARVIDAGKPLGAADVGVLAACGMTDVVVCRQLRVGLLSTGDELREPGLALGAGQIHESNRALLRSLMASPTVQVIDLGISADSLPALSDCLEAAHDVDIIVSSGGVSVGDADCIRPLLERDGRILLWKIAMKPGRPLTLGSLRSGQPWIGLPGNPVSAALTCALLVQPALRSMLGMQPQPALRLRAQLQGRLQKLPGRVEYQRGVLEQDEYGTSTVTTTGLQDSHVLLSLSQANCLIELPLDSDGAESGDEVVVVPFQTLHESRL